MAESVWKAWVEEPWMGVSRRVTVASLQRVLQRVRQATPMYGSEPDRLLYVAASALPYHISGYVTRTHEILRALLMAGGQVCALTRPGYPWDRADRQADLSGLSTRVDDIDYTHVRRPFNHWPVLAYARLASAGIARHAQAHRAAVIHAASNHVNALPALLAARRLGIPFQYEMRGLWELTRISRMPEYEGSQAFRQGLQLESLVARHADRLFVISDQLGRYVVDQWGVDPARLALLPNCVDPDRFVPADPELIQPHTLAYAGSLIGYEGLDTLIEAVHRLVQSGHPVSLAIIGDGEARAALQAQVLQLGLEDRVRFLGKVPPERARQELASCALVCIPRKPYQVCEIVPPIKLVEALAMAKPVIVPDLPVFRDELGASPAGWFFRAGDAADLARVLESALSDHARLASLGQAARRYAVAQRNWKDYVPQLLWAARGEEGSC